MDGSTSSGTLLSDSPADFNAPSRHDRTARPSPTGGGMTRMGLPTRVVADCARTDQVESRHPKRTNRSERSTSVCTVVWLGPLCQGRARSTRADRKRSDGPMRMTMLGWCGAAYVARGGALTMRSEGRPQRTSHTATTAGMPTGHQRSRQTAMTRTERQVRAQDSVTSLVSSSTRRLSLDELGIGGVFMVVLGSRDGGSWTDVVHCAEEADVLSNPLFCRKNRTVLCNPKMEPISTKLGDLSSGPVPVHRAPR